MSDTRIKHKQLLQSTYCLQLIKQKVQTIHPTNSQEKQYTRKQDRKNCTVTAEIINQSMDQSNMCTATPMNGGAQHCKISIKEKKIKG